MKNFLWFIFFIVILNQSCRKTDDFDTNENSRLNFSIDTVLFDTVFTEQGTTTRSFKIFNYNKKSILINNVKLFGGDNSSFKININGVSTNTLNDIEVKANDSIYVFVKAFINPNNLDSTFLVEDSISINFNKKNISIPLIAYGQNAIYHKNEVLNNDITFTSNKPHIIFNNLTITKNTTLTINAGTKLYFHKNAKLVANGNIKAIGTEKDSIIFSSDRLERIYKDEPGQWEGIHFTSSSQNNQLHYCIIKNAKTGVRADSLSNTSLPKLLINNSIIKNHEISGIIAYNSSITGINNLFFNCGQYLLALLNGGNYNFMQNTLAAYNYNFSRSTPAVYISDNSIINPTENNLSAKFINNIIWGNLQNEIELKQFGNKVFDYNFENNLIKTFSENNWDSSNIINVDPLFLNSKYGNFKLSLESIASQKGKNLSADIFSALLNTDINNRNRTYPSTLGCYELE